jgi:hypothetical protein
VIEAASQTKTKNSPLQQDLDHLRQKSHQKAWHRTISRGTFHG